MKRERERGTNLESHELLELPVTMVQEMDLPPAEDDLLAVILRDRRIPFVHR